MASICLHCKKEILPEELKVWRFSGWTIHGPTPAPQKKRGAEEDEFDLKFHKICFPIWDKERIEGLARLDGIMNNNPYFKRDKGMTGWYIRDGKSCPVNAKWDVYTIEGKYSTETLKRLEISELYKGLGNFQSFLKENNFDYYADYR